MALPSFIKTLPGGVCLFVKLQPRASKNEIAEPIGNEIKIKVTAPPVDWAANEALLEFLADTFNCPRGAVQLLRGQTSRHKQIFLQGLNAETVLSKLSYTQ